MHNTIAVVDFGGQYAHLIANRIRRLGLYSEIVPPSLAIEEFERFCGIILSGSPHSVLDASSPTLPLAVIKSGIPVLGLCYGHQLIAQVLGGKVCKGEIREYGSAEMTISTQSPLFKGLAQKQKIWMSHGDTVETFPPGFKVLGSTSDCPNAAISNNENTIFGLQFHPEVTDTPGGMTILSNFLDICGCERNWNTSTFLQDISEQIRINCQDRKVFLLVSGGVDSTVVFTLLNKVLGPQRVLGLHIDTGMMRYEESTDVIDYMKKQGFENLHIFDASDEFVSALKGVTHPEEKRRIIGNQFIVAKEKAQQKLGLTVDEWLLAQGTIYPDTIESAGTKHADKIKTHHNRVDIILELIEKGLVIEPLAQLYKDEVRQLGEALGLPHELVWRHPFPGPGLGVRILCSDAVDEPVDASVQKRITELAAGDGYSACVLPVRSVGVQGDSRTYAHPALLIGPRRWDVLERVSTRITNSIKPINRVVFAIALQSSPHYTLIAGYVTKQRLDLLRRIDHCITAILKETGEYEQIWQMPVVLLPLVNEKGNACVVLRPITSQEAMTARFFPLKAKTLELIVAAAAKIDGIGDLFIDVTHKPPGTIEWE